MAEARVKLHQEYEEYRQTNNPKKKHILSPTKTGRERRDEYRFEQKVKQDFARSIKRERTTCAYCQKEFEYDRVGTFRKYCTSECSALASAKIKAERRAKARAGIKPKPAFVPERKLLYCANCGDLFYYMTGAGQIPLYCSPKCRKQKAYTNMVESRKTKGPISNTCLYCKKEFTYTKNSNWVKKFCSRECSDNALKLRSKPITIICQICKKEHTYDTYPGQRLQTTCSPECKRIRTKQIHDLANARYRAKKQRDRKVKTRKTRADSVLPVDSGNDGSLPDPQVDSPHP